MIEVDYLVVGAGAVGMAFTDTILAETDATVALVDRNDRPGGHWNLAYPFVRLHQPSAFYGVNSRPLGSGRRDTTGGNAGLFELASRADVLAYFDDVLRETFLPTGRCHYLPGADFAAGAVVSRSTGARQEVRAGTVVDASYSDVVVPAMRRPPFEVGDGVRCIAPNDLPLVDLGGGHVVIGGGKTGVDACLWLLSSGVDPSEIRWVVPRDAWLLDRATIQPVSEFFDRTAGGFAAQLECSAGADTVDDLFARLEDAGQLLRLDPAVTPAMYRCATVTRVELDELRRIGDVVRRGRVRSVTTDRITLDTGEIATSPDALHIDCTADGLPRRTAVPTFEPGRITLQSVRTCQQVFSAAFIAHVEATVPDATRKNKLCRVIPHPDAAVDWLETTLLSTMSLMRWTSDPELAAWLADARLNSVKFDAHIASTPAQEAILGAIVANIGGAVRNLTRLLRSA